MEKIFLYASLLGISILGQLIHISIKLKAMQQRAVSANLPFRPKELWEKDWTNMLLSFLCNLALLVGFSELASYSEVVKIWPKCLFLLSGYTGSSLVLSWLSKADKAQQTAVSQITNTKTMDEIWAIDYQYDSDIFFFNNQELSPEDFGIATAGDWQSSTKSVTWETEPPFSTVGVTIYVMGNRGNTYLAVPIKRPR